MDHPTDIPQDDTSASVLTSAIYGLSSLCGIAFVVEAAPQVQEEDMARTFLKLLPHIMVGVGAILQGAAAFRRSGRKIKL